MTVLEKVKEVIREYYEYADCGIFNTKNIVGDTMTTVYEEMGVVVDVCYGYAYFEVFGLNDEEFEELENYYDSL